MSTMNWKEPETKAKLLLAVLASQDENALSGAKAAKIAEYMGCTAKAVTHQLTALRKELTEFKAADGQVTVTSAKKRKAKASDEDDGSASPAKKTKATPKKKPTKSAKKVVEEEDHSESNVDDEVAARKDKAEGKEDSEDDEIGDAGDVKDKSA